VQRGLRPLDALSKVTSNSIPNRSDNTVGLATMSWISIEKDAYKQLTDKFTESSCDVFRKRFFMNTDEGRFSEFIG
jgi:hypothetical protein